MPHEDGRLDAAPNRDPVIVAVTASANALGDLRRHPEYEDEGFCTRGYTDRVVLATDNVLRALDELREESDAIGTREELIHNQEP